MCEKLYTLMREYYNDFLEKKKTISEIIVNDSFPIVWFGNMKKFCHQNSKIKVLTFGLNPSNNEFPKDNPEMRFPGARDAYEQGRMGRVCDSLNGYFDCKRAPYWKWFYAYERVLGFLPFGVTYGGIKSRWPTAINYAIHLDFFSAIATDPTYSGLKKKKSLLQNTELFDKLFHYLTDSWAEPVIVLFSTSKDEICRHCGLTRRNIFYEEFDEGKVRVEAFKVDNKIFIWGNPNIKPFQGVKDAILKKSLDEICHIIGVSM